MNDEDEDRTFNDEQRAIFEQPKDAPVKTRPRTPGERNAPPPVPDVDADEGSGRSPSEP